MNTTKFQEYIHALHYYGEMIDLRTDIPKIGTAFILHVYDERTGSLFAKSCFAADAFERQAWQRSLAKLTAARRLQVGPLPCIWTLPGTTVAHLAPEAEPERGPWVRLRSDEL